MIARRYGSTRSSALSLASTTGSLCRNIKTVQILPRIPPISEGLAPRCSSPPPLKITPSEPICDPDVPMEVTIGTSCEADEVELNVDLNIPPLPATPNHPEFVAIFKRKCELCAECRELPNTEKGRRVQQIVKETVTELLEFYNRIQGVRELNKACHRILLDTIAVNVFKPPAAIDWRLLIGEEAPKVASRDLTIFEKYFQLLQRLFSVPACEELFEPMFHVKIMKALGSPDVNEHVYVLQALMQYYVAFPKRRDAIVTTGCNMCVEYLQGLRQPFCVWPLLSFFAKILKALVPSVPPKWLDLMRWTVLPLAKGPHLSWYGDPLANVLNVLSVVDSDLLVEFVVYFLKHWPETKASKQRAFLDVITLLAEQLTLKAFMSVARPLFALYAKCSNSENARLCEAAYKIWNSPKLIILIVERAKVVFPIMHSAIVEASKSHWNSQVKTAAFTVLKRMHEIDPFVYDELNTKHIRGIPQKIRVGQQKNWAIITRLAAKTDSGVNLAEKLSEVQLIFNTDRPAVTMSSGTNRGHDKRILSPANNIRKTTVWR